MPVVRVVRVVQEVEAIMVDDEFDGVLIGSLTEAEVLERIIPIMGAPESGAEVRVGPGDDAAVLRTGDSVVLSTDSMVRGLDWRDDWSSAADVGVKVVAQNVADMAAMGAVPSSLLLSCAFDPSTPLTWALDLSRGIAHAAREVGCPVLGGDLSAAPAGVVLVSVSITGDLQGRAPVLRSGARPGEVVAVCGSLGWSGAGLSLYAAGAAGGDQGRDGAAAAAVMRYHRAPQPPWRAGVTAAQAGATSMIDISDGLVRDAGRIAAASGVTLALDEEVLRSEFVAGVVADVVGEQEGWQQVLAGGEEHSLLATFPAGAVPVDTVAADTGEGPWRVIGEVIGAGSLGPQVLVGAQVPQVLGWDHFAG